MKDYSKKLFNSKQIEYMRYLGLESDLEDMTGENITYDESCDIEDMVGDRLIFLSQDDKDWSDEEKVEADMCGDILDILAYEVSPEEPNANGKR